VPSSGLNGLNGCTGKWNHLTDSLETKANAGPESCPIMEAKKNDDPMADPWE